MQLCKDIYGTCVWPEDFLKSMLIPMEKRVNAVRCEDHRKISLIVHASKIMLKILYARMERKANEFIEDDQFGFTKGKGTREAIAAICILGERSMEHLQELYVCMIDIEEAFDRVNWTKLMDIIKDIGVDWRDRRLVTNLYMNQTVTMRINNEESDTVIVGRGVKQGCLL